MSIFNELLVPKFNEITLGLKSLENDIEAILEKFEVDYEAGRNHGKEKAQKEMLGKITLQSINENDDEPKKTSEADSNISDSSSNGQIRSKKRSKNEAEDILSPEVDKRLKRTASVKAQTFISKQVNVNLTAKLRRENSDATPASDKTDKNTLPTTKGRRRKDDKENEQPNVPVIQIKEEKISLPPEPMDTESLVIEAVVKQEVNKDDIAMPPPTMPVPRPRKAASKTVSEAEGEGEARRSRTKKKSEAPPAPVPGARATRASSRASSRAAGSARADASASAEPAEPAPRPKRTRAKKKVSVSEAQSTEVDSTQSLQETVSVSATASPADKPRPKRTRRGKAAEKQEPPKPEPQPEPILSPKEEPTSVPSSPILQKNVKTKNTNNLTTISLHTTTDSSKIQSVADSDMDKTRVISRVESLHNEVEDTVDKPNNMNETMVIQPASNQTVVLEKAPILDHTVVLSNGQSKLTEDNSLLTDDESVEFHTPPPPHCAPEQPSSAVKEKVQQFEELATRVTRTKTRQQQQQQPAEQAAATPPERAPALSADTLAKMNSLIFNGKHTQISSSASKPRALPAPRPVTSASKLSSLMRMRESADEDARRKKEALLEAKREQQRRKREDKMAAAALARTLAEKERQHALELAERGRLEKQANVDQGKERRRQEHERKKAEAARKALETEERRRAEEAARALKLAEEQRRHSQQRRKQQHEQEAMKKEAAIMAKEIEKRQKEYLDKQRMKSKLEDKMSTPLKGAVPGGRLSPVHMQDGFQFLNSDSEEESPPRPVPAWSTSKARNLQLSKQSLLAAARVDRLFCVRVHSPDLAAIFPGLERARMQRTSSAVWRTPV